MTHENSVSRMAVPRYRYKYVVVNMTGARKKFLISLARYAAETKYCNAKNK